MVPDRRSREFNQGRVSGVLCSERLELAHQSRCRAGAPLELVDSSRIQASCPSDGGPELAKPAAEAVFLFALPAPQSDPAAGPSPCLGQTHGPTWLCHDGLTGITEMAKKRVSILQREGIKLSAFRTVQPPPNKPSASASCRQNHRRPMQSLRQDQR